MKFAKLPKFSLNSISNDFDGTHFGVWWITNISQISPFQFLYSSISRFLTILFAGLANFELDQLAFIETRIVSLKQLNETFPF